jgi:hypothetical protein
MYIITATFDVDAAQAKVAELLALGDSPDRLAERLGVQQDIDFIKEAVAPVSFKQVIADIGRIQRYITLEKEIEDLKSDKSLIRFLGSRFKEKQLAKLEEGKRNLGALLDAPRWFYKQPRVRLLSAIRDYALEGSQQGDAVWSEVDEKSLVFPIAEIFENADLDGAEELVKEIEKPLKEIGVRFILESFEGNRSISFNLEKGLAIYYAPTAGAIA